MTSPSAIGASAHAVRLLFATRIVRLFAYGALSVVLVFYLVEAGLSEGQAGLLLTLTLLGDTAISLVMTTTADRLGRRRMLIAGAVLMALAGVVMATPEYHGTFSAFTKLIIENLGHPSPLRNKPVALLGVAAGRIGAIKSVEHLRSVLAHVGALVIPGSIAVAGIQTAFDRKSGAITDAPTEEALRGLARSLVTFLKEYVCPRYILESQVRDEAATRPLVLPV